MATMIGLYAVLERLRYWFTEDSLYRQLVTKDAKNLDNLWRLIASTKDAEARYMHVPDKNIATQVRQLEKILYRIEDLVELHQVGVASRNKACMMSSILKRMSGWVANHKLRAELKNLARQITDTDYMERCSAREQTSQASSSLKNDVGGPGLPRTSTLLGEHGDGGQIIRKLHDEGKLASALIGGSRNVEVVSICGMGGIGKTTLARTLYNNLYVRQHFPACAWVTVTSEFQPRDIFLGILSHMQQLHSELFAKIDDMGLAEKVYKRLKARRWLVVLDDVRSIEVWESIKLVFPEDNVGSRILVTTRLKRVALSMSEGEHIHDMSFLDDEQSWELFKRRAQLTDSKLDLEVEKIAKKILRQSGGLPLAIVMLANILKTKSFNEWKLLLRDSAVEISETHAFGALEHLSYNSLPSVLKPCLLYMSTFPEGSKVEADTMCQLWIAEGLVSEEHCRNNGVTMMELAGNYFDELASGNLVQVSEEEISTHQSFRYGCIYDLIRDICISKAKEEEFFEVVNLGHAHQPKGSVYRCAIYLDKHEKMEIHPYLRSDLRSLLFFNSCYQSGEDLIGPWAIPNLSNLKWIRILHFDGVDFRGGTLPPGIENLVLLRYLCLRDCYLEKLPPYISNFLFLITLDLRVKKWCKVIIPNVLCKLQKLRHLYLPLKFQTPNHEKLQLDGMKELEILENFDTGICNVREIFMLTKLHRLAVSSEGELEGLEQIFKCIELNAKHLSKTSLDIRNFDSYSEERLSFIKKLFSCRVLHILRLEGHIEKMPELDVSCTSFTEIHLNGSQLEDDPMQTLKGLPKLRILVLENEAYTGKEMYCSDFGFPELRSLKLSKLYNLESWKLGVNAMPKLSTLTIENCRRMEMLPKELECIKALRKLTINMMSKEFLGRLLKVDGKGEGNLDKISTNFTIEFGSDNLFRESMIQQWSKTVLSMAK